MTMLAEVLNAFRRAWHLILPFLATHLVLRLIVTALVVPGASLLLGLTIATSDRSALTDQDILRFLLTPLGLLGGLAVASILLTASVLDVAAMTVTIRTGQHRPLAALRGAAVMIGPRLPRILRFSLALILRVLVLVLPFAAAGGAVALWLLTDHDINYFLTYRPPAFLLAAGLIGAILLALATLLLPRLASWAIALPLVMFGLASPGGSFAASAQRLSGRRRGLVARIAIWVALRSLLAAGAAGLLGLSVNLLPFVSHGGLALAAGVAAGLLALWALTNAVISALAHGALACLMSDLFAGTTGTPKALSLPAGPGPRLHPAALALGAAGLVLVGLLAGNAVLSRVGADRTVAVIAHRGAAALRPENTLAAVQKAIEDGADWVEIDVQEIADGTVAVAHDQDFMKLAQVPLKVWQATPDDISRIDIGSRFGPDYADARTPMLAEVLALAKGRARVLIELKFYGHDDRLAERVVALVDAAGMANQVASMSLSYPQVQAMAALRPDWPRGVLAARAIGDLTGLDADFIAVNTGQISVQLLNRAHRAGKQVYVWTVDDAMTMSRLMSMGVDGIITNDPGLARRVIAERDALSAPERLMLWLADRFRLGSFRLSAEERDA